MRHAPSLPLNLGITCTIRRATTTNYQLRPFGRLSPSSLPPHRPIPGIRPGARRRYAPCTTWLAAACSTQAGSRLRSRSLAGKPFRQQRSVIARCASVAPATLGRMPDGMIRFRRHAKIVMPVHGLADARRVIRRKRCHGEPHVIRCGARSVLRPVAAMDELSAAFTRHWKLHAGQADRARQGSVRLPASRSIDKRRNGLPWEPSTHPGSRPT